MTKLKIICSSQLKKTLTEGILFVLTKIGCSCYIWDRKKKPFFDMLDEQNPDILFLGCKEEQGLSIAQSEKKFKTVLFGSQEPEDKYDLWCCQYKNQNLKHEKIYNIDRYANTIKYSGNYNKNDNKTYDIIYFVDEPVIAHKTITDNINKIFNEISTKNNIRFAAFGDKPSIFRLNEYIGSVNNFIAGQLLFNCKIGIDIFAGSYFDFALFKKPCITLFANDIFSSCFSIEDFYKTLNELYLDENLRQKIGIEAYDKIYKLELTDCHIAANILNKINYNDIGKECLKIL